MIRTTGMGKANTGEDVNAGNHLGDKLRRKTEYVSVN